MFKTFLKIGVRNIFRDKMHAAINIIGLSIGIAIAILISLWVLDEVTLLDTGLLAEVAQATNLATAFTALTFLISCMGIFGLASFTIEQRRKEIGIRKVLGAGIAQMTKLLSADFLKLVSIAILLACPITWWVMNSWLEHFSYRTQITWWIFAIAGLLTIFIALITVSFRTLKAALTNPINNLRDE